MKVVFTEKPKKKKSKEKMVKRDTDNSNLWISSVESKLKSEDVGVNAEERKKKKKKRG